jgi:hypothetical protein
MAPRRRFGRAADQERNAEHPSTTRGWTQGAAPAAAGKRVLTLRAETGMSICNRNRIMTGVKFLFRPLSPEDLEPICQEIDSFDDIARQMTTA